jgi:hypothetical protein
MPVWLAWLGSRVGHYLVYLLITLLLLWCIYVTIIKPHTKPTPTTEQKATTIINNTFNCKALIGWGCGKK